MKTIKLTELQLKGLLNEIILEEPKDDSSDDGTYMVLQNLMQIKNDIEKILSFKDEKDFSKLVTGEHAWAGDHITTSKDDIEEVANFISTYFSEDETIVESKNMPTNPKLWASSLSWAKRRYKVCPSAYCNGAAAKRYKSKGGGWKKSTKK